MSAGIVLIVIGVLMVVQAIFPIDIPIGKIAVALFFIYMGITMLVPGMRHKHWNHEPKTEERAADIHVNAVFGSAEVEIDPKMPVSYEISSVLGATEVPEKTSAIAQPGSPTLNLKLNSVFGHITVVNKDAK